MVIESVPKLARRKRPGDAERSLAKELALLAEQEQREVLTVSLAARLLGKSTDTIYRWLEEEKLSGRKIGGRWIIYRDSVQAVWEAGRVERQEGR